jgi:hypothetical protein
VGSGKNLRAIKAYKSELCVRSRITQRLKPAFKSRILVKAKSAVEKTPQTWSEFGHHMTTFGNAFWEGPLLR